MSSHTLTTTADTGHESRFWWMSAVLGILTVAVGVAALVWPEATIRVVGLLFGLNLLVTGLIRAGLCLVVSWYPVLYRVLGVVFGVLSAIVGIICMRNVLASAVLLIVFVAIGWLLDGIIELSSALAGAQDPLRMWRAAAGAVYLLAGVVVLVWPALSLRVFLVVGAVALIVVGIAQAAVSLGLARAARRPAG
ncbi:HdeD family acid-resistance protein [Paractinoplanes brasiliensis]|uniref:Uncharacterized membrane protein HdeD (DUF308 family) n=1 Tax=Paractinoplanes brasiliensis TaxID=52695 RepID=A0A4V3C860_9ACTN|nr:DUF308 domain-containing protein [Actinoplanes brasiliensis]TDO40468.1 uncharacterized membrane protein HdeD (DUF308 family) [Actinoplanes brasiliensis]GID25535.1 membrane protein [Actinoplanes brasiliensis]